MLLKSGDNGRRVKALQETLLAIDPQALPKYGADGDMGRETFAACARLLGAPSLLKTEALDHFDQQRLLDMVAGGRCLGTVDNRPIANVLQRKFLRSPKAAYDIAWHQADCEMGEKPSRFTDSSAHFFVTSGGQVIQLHDIEWLTYHAHALNEETIGIEIEGMFAGIEGDNSNESWPKYHKVLNRKSQALTQVQIDAAKGLVRNIKSFLQSRGGSLRHYYAHRQGSNMRDRDPGELIWKNIVRPSALELGIEMPVDRVFGQGRTIPKEWLV